MEFDVAVVGTGTMGSAAARELAMRGKRVVMIDAFEPPHSLGSHHGDTRIIRFAYGEGERYVPMLVRAGELWRGLEEECGEVLLRRCGVLNCGVEGSGFVGNVLGSAERFGLGVERLSGDEVNARWPGFGVPGDFVGAFEPDAGFLAAEGSVRAMVGSALRHGAVSMFSTRVESIVPCDGGVLIGTSGGEVRAGSVVVTSGAWAKGLLERVGVELPLRVVRKTFGWYGAGDGYGAESFPCLSFETDFGIYYGFPDVDGAGLKVGRHDTGMEVVPGAGLEPFGEGDDAELRAFLSRMLSAESFERRDGRTCVYTMTPDEDFVLDRHPVFGNIVFACGFSGHGFKFAPVIGEVMADLLLKGESAFDLTPFRADRFGLKR